MANKLGHHPRLIIDWGFVEVITTTHDQGNVVTQKDWELTQQIDLLI